MYPIYNQSDIKRISAVKEKTPPMWVMILAVVVTLPTLYFGYLWIAAYQAVPLVN
jgi:type VI protein secretion system component VasF